MFQLPLRFYCNQKSSDTAVFAIILVVDNDIFLDLFVQNRRTIKSQLGSTLRSVGQRTRLEFVVFTLPRKHRQGLRYTRYKLLWIRKRRIPDDRYKTCWICGQEIAAGHSSAMNRPRSAVLVTCVLILIPSSSSSLPG